MRIWVAFFLQHFCKSLCTRPAHSPGLCGPAGGTLTLPPSLLPLSPRCRISHNWILSPDRHLRYPANSTTTTLLLSRESEQRLFRRGHLKMHKSYIILMSATSTGPRPPIPCKPWHTELRNNWKQADTDRFFIAGHFKMHMKTLTGNGITIQLRLPANNMI